MKPALRTVGSLALLYAIRMIGLFMVLPVLSVAGLSYESASAASLGLALGIYGLTQACFQIPLGLLSDFIGRKPVILLGLAIFALGSVIAAMADSVNGLIIGRALQGSGAIASTVMALVSDLTTEENRTKAMAAIGASIGLSFTLALILGPVLNAVIGLEGIFYLTCVLSFAGAALIIFVVPTPKALPVKGGGGAQKRRGHRDAGAIPSLLGKAFFTPELARLNWGIFTLHAVLTAMFVAVPLMLIEHVDLPTAEHWKVYCPVLLISFIAMLPIMIFAEKRDQAKLAFVSAILLLSVVLGVMAWLGGQFIIAGLFLFFVAFNLLEAMLPSLVSKTAAAGSKGTAMGIYSTWQFLGAFVGGVTGGLLVGQQSVSTLFAVAALACLSWFVVALFMRKPRPLSSMCFEVSADAKGYDFAALNGVEEAVYVAEDGLLYVKVDKRQLDIDALKSAVELYAQ